MAAAAFSSTTSVAAPPASTPSIFLGKKKLNRLQRSCRGRHGSRGLSSRVFASNYKQEVEESKQTDSDRWRGLAYDVSDDQQDITRGKGLVDSLFQAPMGDGTHEAVLSSYEYISQGLRDYTAWDNIKDGYYIAPAFMDKLVVHIAKNFMARPKIKVPLILGIWGGKGQGKSFQCELVFAKMGINPVVMSAGELETVYDDEVRRWVAETGVENIGRKLVNSKEGPPKFEQPKMTIAKLLEYGHMLGRSRRTSSACSWRTSTLARRRSATPTTCLSTARRRSKPACACPSPRAAPIPGPATSTPQQGATTAPPSTTDELIKLSSY
ncbi:hypothetical protein PVAP13_8NG297950 [Panicum virgatum]|uniref:Ribulose bisphosphate carboxylase/oxygenase activase AAA helical domain-containing protein n=1 Tax=Panicum virgatum TaxID=38727 RepID=A0A8T0PMM7_PANVG|nr:hypothetical protein PVAP13_8NG297950 [Panicum virgatum]